VAKLIARTTPPLTPALSPCCVSTVRIVHGAREDWAASWVGLGTAVDTSVAANDCEMTLPKMTHERQYPVLVLGLGNDLLTDDGIGLEVVRHVRDCLRPGEPIAIEETVEMGVALLDFMAGYPAVVLVDAVQTGRMPAGFVHELAAEQLSLLPGVSPHFLGVGEVLALGRVLGYDMPERVEIFAIEVADPFTLGTRMTEALEAVVEPVAQRVLVRARQMLATIGPTLTITKPAEESIAVD
jgi:hydrogenase maturation protease